MSALKAAFLGSALQHAAAADDVPQMLKLLEVGADVDSGGMDSTGVMGITSLHIGAGRGCLAVVQALLACHARVDQADAAGATALHYAAVQSGSAEVVRELLQRGGANVEARDCEGRTPLYCAVINGNDAAAMALLQGGAYVDAAANDGSDALHEAAFQGNDSILCALLEAGACVGAVNNEGATPLHAASYPPDARASTVSLLLLGGARVGARDRHGDTALHLSAEKGGSIAQALLQGGADLHATNNAGKTAMQRAIARRHVKVMVALMTWGL